MKGRTNRLLKSTRKISPDSDPELFHCFSSIKDKLGVKKKVRLRVGDTQRFGGYAVSRRNCGFVFISDFYVEEPDSSALKFIVGHELGHVLFYENTCEERPAGSTEKRAGLDYIENVPLTLVTKILHLLLENYANCCGTAVCGGTESAFDYFGDIPNGCGFHYFTRLEKRMLELIAVPDPNGQFSCGDVWQYLKYAGSDEFADELKQMLNPILLYSEEDERALTDFTAAALFINIESCENRDQREICLELSDDIDRFKIKRDAIGRFGSIKEAVGTMDGLKSRVAEIDHPLRYEAMKLIAETAYMSEENDRNAADCFVYETGQDMGFSPEELLTCMELCRWVA